MQVLEDFLSRLKALDIPTLIREVVEENTHYLEDKNTEQMYAGRRADGSNIYPPYAPFTVEIKKAQGMPFDRVTLKDTGDFHSSVKAKTQNQTVIMYATDPKTQELKFNYGEEILGIDEPNLNEFKQDILKPEMQDKARAKLTR